MIAAGKRRRWIQTLQDEVGKQGQMAGDRSHETEVRNQFL